MYEEVSGESIEYPKRQVILENRDLTNLLSDVGLSLEYSRLEI